MKRRVRPLSFLAQAFGVGVAIVAMVFVWIMVLMPDVLPHEAPAGWSYPFNCCGKADCRQLPATSVKERPGGYEIQSNGELVGYTDPRLRDSPDGEFHRCSTGGAEAGKTICLFVPPRAY